MCGYLGKWIYFLQEAAIEDYSFTREAAISMGSDEEAWRPYFEDGYSPEEALREDLSYG